MDSCKNTNKLNTFLLQKRGTRAQSQSTQSLAQGQKWMASCTNSWSFWAPKALGIPASQLCSYSKCTSSGWHSWVSCRLLLSLVVFSLSDMCSRLAPTATQATPSPVAEPETSPVISSDLQFPCHQNRCYRLLHITVWLPAWLLGTIASVCWSADEEGTLLKRFNHNHVGLLVITRVYSAPAN